jgi:hypothetical protein
MSSTHPPLDIPFQRLREVRAALLRLHKRLLDSEREGYEQSHGRIRSNGESFFGLFSKINGLAGCVRSLNLSSRLTKP